MKLVSRVLSVLAFAIIVVGCASSNADHVSSQSEKPKLADTSAPSEQPVSPDANTASNQANNDKTFRGILAARKERLDARQAGEGNSSTSVSASNPITRPAPENSEYFVVLTDVALETRTFKDHPQLLKVEKTIDPKKQVIKVFLRDGRVIELSGEKIASIGTASSVAILKAAGITPSASVPKRDKAKPNR